MKSSFNTSIIAFATLSIFSGVTQAEGEAQSVQPHPNAPSISNETWAILEASDAYRNLPKAHSINVNFEATSLREPMGGTKALAATTVEEVSSRKSRPFGVKCNQIVPPKPLDTYITYNCSPMMELAMAKYPEGAPSVFNVKFLEIKGSLFPMREGAEFSSTYVGMVGPNREIDFRYTQVCKVTNQGSAKEIDAKLTGIAWTVKCTQSSVIDKTGKPMPGYEAPMLPINYFLTDKGIFLSQIGVWDAANEKYVIPTTGSIIVESLVKGGYGAKITRTYKSYDWSVED